MEQMLNYITTIINGTNAQLYNNIINGTNAQLYNNYN